MYNTVNDLIKEWNFEAAHTQKVLDALTDKSLNQKVYDEGRTLGKIAWHFVTNIPEYLVHFGFAVEVDEDSEVVPTSATVIADTFRKISEETIETIRTQLTNDKISKTQSMFGRTESNATVFMGLIKHIVHHRGQLTILMRQAGLKVPGVYGPSAEEWETRFGVKAKS